MGCGSGPEQRSNPLVTFSSLSPPSSPRAHPISLLSPFAFSFGGGCGGSSDVTNGSCARSHWQKEIGSWIRCQWRPLPAAGSLGSIRFLRFSIEIKKKGGYTTRRRMKREDLLPAELCSVLCGWDGGWEARKKARRRGTGCQSPATPRQLGDGPLLSSSSWGWGHLKSLGEMVPPPPQPPFYFCVPRARIQVLQVHRT